MENYPLVRWPKANTSIDWGRFQVKRKLHIYASYAMTGVHDPEAHYRNVERIFEVPSRFGHSIYLPHVFSDPVKHAHFTPEEIYQLDRGQVERADLVIAFCNQQPAYGIGIEAMFALNRRIPIVLVHESTVSPSRLLRGLPNVIEVVGNDLEELGEGLRVVLSEITAKAAA